MLLKLFWIGRFPSIFFRCQLVLFDIFIVFMSSVYNEVNMIFGSIAYANARATIFNFISVVLNCSIYPVADVFSRIAVGKNIKI